MDEQKANIAGITIQFKDLQEEKQNRLRTLYEQLDVDKNGRVDLKELAAALKSRMPNVSETSDYAEQIMKQAARAESTTGIDFNEFVNYVLEHERKLEVTFKDLDRNKDGVIDVYEVKRMLQDLGVPTITDADAANIIKRMTRDGRNSIDLDEFQQYFLLHPSALSSEIAKYWHRGLFIDIGEQAPEVPETVEKSGRWKHLLAGGVAGAVSRTSTAPLDRLKIFLQVHASRENGFGVVNSFQYMLKEGGIKALWRGNGVNVIKIIPESAIKFWAYEQAKVMIASNKQGGQLSVGERFVAGSIAGAISQTAVYPMEVLKTKLALRKTGEMNRGMFDALRTVYRVDGLRAFGRGYLPNLIGIVPYCGTEMAVYESLKSVCVNAYFADKDPGLMVVLGCGMVSSTVAQVVSYPLALVRTRLQAHVHADNQPSSMIGQFNYIVRHEGFFGLDGDYKISIVMMDESGNESVEMKDASVKQSPIHQLSEEKRQRLKELYDSLDVDKDGRVDLKELATALKKRVTNEKEASTYAQEIMSRADTNRDSGIDFNEFVEYSLEHERKLALTFHDLDKNNDGVIDFSEVRKHLEDLGLKSITDQQAKEIIAKVDLDGNNTIGLDEFQHYFMLHPSCTSEDIAKYWHRSLFFDIGDQSIPVHFLDDTSTWWKYLPAGGIAGGVSRTSTAPLERMKVFLQVYASRQNGHGVLSSLRYLLQEGGLKALWRGNGVNVFKIVPESAVKFWSYEKVKYFIASHNKTGRLNASERFVAGTTAGVISQTFVYPLEVLKTRLALRRTGEMNQGVYEAFRTVFHSEGWRAFGRGYLPNLIGIAPYAGTELAVYESLKNMCIDNYYANRDPGVVVLLMCGMAGSAVAQLVAYPFALVRTRLQAHAVDQPETMFGQFKFILRHEGMAGLYRGLVPNFLKVLPSVGISYVVFEIVRKRLGVSSI